MNNEIEKIKILRIKERKKEKTDDLVIKEYSLTIFLNNVEFITLLCSPMNLEYLTLGFLLSEEIIDSHQDIKSIKLDKEKGIIKVKIKKEFKEKIVSKRIITSGCAKGITQTDSLPCSVIDFSKKIDSSYIFKLVDEIKKMSNLFRLTGGVHSAALANNKKIIIFQEDIGRHNCFDKIFGECLVKNISTSDKIIITTGRISSEILLKVARRKIPYLVSLSCPTNIAVDFAKRLNITLMGFVRDSRMNVYSGIERILI